MLGLLRRAGLDDFKPSRPIYLRLTVRAACTCNMCANVGTLPFPSLDDPINHNIWDTCNILFQHYIHGQYGFYGFWAISPFQASQSLRSAKPDRCRSDAPVAPGARVVRLDVEETSRAPPHTWKTRSRSQKAVPKVCKVMVFWAVCRSIGP